MGGIRMYDFEKTLYGECKNWFYGVCPCDKDEPCDDERECDC